MPDTAATVTIAPGEYVLARWPKDDRVDHVYHRPDAGPTLAPMCSRWAPWVLPAGGLAPAKGRRCKACSAWAASNPEITVRDTAPAEENLLA